MSKEFPGQVKLSDMAMTKKIAEYVSRAGGRTFFVGGFVRDRLMKNGNEGILQNDSKDIDIEVHGISADLLRNILNELGQCTEMGSSFGIFGLTHHSIDIAMPRKERATGRGHRDFKVDVDPFLGTYQASLRRDFTINAMMQDVLTEEIIDHFGGRRDLELGILRHVNSETFIEDPLRVLRGAQFASRFGLHIAEETEHLCTSMNLENLAKERIFGEMEKALLKGSKPSVFFEELRRMNQLTFWFPELEELIAVPQNPAFHPEGDVWTHTMLVLDQAAGFRTQAREPLGFMISALMHDIGEPTTTTISEDGRIRSIGHEHETQLVAKALERITSSKKLVSYVINMVDLHMQPNSMIKQGAKTKAMNKMFDRSCSPEDLLLLAKADHLGCGGTSSYDEVEESLQEALTQYKELMLQPEVVGEDLIKAGCRPGKDFKEILEFTHKMHLAGVPKEQALKQALADFRKKSQ